MKFLENVERSNDSDDSQYAYLYATKISGHESQNNTAEDKPIQF